MNVILQNIRLNRLISLRQLLDEILADNPSFEVDSTLSEVVPYVVKLIEEVSE